MISIALKAKNSSGLQHLILDYNDEEKDFSFTLCGTYEGKNIQIDFDPVQKYEIQDLMSLIELRLEKALEK